MNPTTEAPIDREIRALVEGTSQNAFAVLGPHEDSSGWVVRALYPAAKSVEVRLSRTGELRPMTMR
jgi:1,4-alpha-glucan branching enzyme